MQHRRCFPLLAAALLSGAEGSPFVQEASDSRPHGGRWHLAASAGQGANHLRLHLKDQIKHEEEKIAKMQETAAHQGLKPAWAAPEDPTQDRLNPDQCKEPKPYRKTDYAGAFGPEKVFCCHTVKQVIEDVMYRCEVECNDAHPCHTSMKEVYCPKYLAAYRKMEAVLCKDRPTTTTTTTVTTTTTTTLPVCLDDELSPSYPCRCGEDGKICDESEVCSHADGTCSFQKPPCANGTVSEVYPCQCGMGKNKKECTDGEVCVDWANGVCEKPKDKASKDDHLQWCYDSCEATMKKATTVEGLSESPEECEEILKEQQQRVHRALGPGCTDLCDGMHKKGALRPEDDHADHAES